MLALLNAIGVELLKMRKNKMLIISSLIVWLITFFMFNTNNDLSLEDQQMLLLAGGIATNMVFSIVSVFVVTVLVQREYQDHTIINLLTAPVMRRDFILSKAVAWFIWHVVTLIVKIVIVVLVIQLTYTEPLSSHVLAEMVGNMARLGLLSYVAFLPLLWITIVQRRLFYPSLFIGIFLSILQNSVGMPFDNMIPWTAITRVSLSESQAVIGTSGIIMGLISIFATGIGGLIFACLSFAKQDQ